MVGAYVEIDRRRATRTRLSKSLGLNGTRTMSLLDLPMMFANLHETTLNNGPFLKTNQFFFYSMCQIRPKFNPPEEKNCFGKWLHFIEKGMILQRSKHSVT